MKTNKVIKIFIIVILLLFVSSVKAEPTTYIYLDLACGEITFTASTYSGCIYKTIDGVTTKETYTNLTHTNTNKYYIYQSNETNQSTTGYVNDVMVIPTYESISQIIETQITNNTDVDNVITTWQAAAENVGRTSTINKITITGNSTFDITVDNIWSNYHKYGTGRTDGGIAFKDSSTGKTIIRLKGDNRVGNVYYRNTSENTSLVFTSNDGDNEITGTLTVANLVTGGKNNYWNSAIGASDTGDHAYNIIFNGGTIYAGTTVGDNCTAIGGGGNGTGKVKINGGIITAVSSTTGTAIGGGIGMSSAGGNAVVDITGGTVYAYNDGYAYAANVFVPGVAIGGGSSRYSNGNTSTTVNITGGTVFAQSRGGVAIGGGSSATKNGGEATVNIGNEANVTANSIDGTYTVSGIEYEIKAGSGIGGGTGGTTGNGGNATVNISGGKIISGTIGGGGTNNPSGTVGSATVKITDGTIIGRVIMYTGTFNISGGILTKGSAENGGCLQMYGGEATISGGEIKECNATNNGGAIYIEGGTFNSKGGTILNNVAQNNGGAVYLGGGTFNSTGGNINNNSSINGGAVYIEDGTVNISDGTIEKNNATTGNGGAIYIGGNGNFIITGGTISSNNSLNGNGGGVFLNSGIYTMENGTIEKNKAINGAGAYINSAKFSLTGGSFNNNNATNNGGGFFIGDNSDVELSNGTISGNDAINGGGFYQTQNENQTTTNISGDCIITKNNAVNGNGGGVYIDGGSIFRMIGGKVTYNNASQNTTSKTLAKESTKGVGGGVYILNGTFTMYDEDNNAGTAAIFGNTADFAADDLFASGENTSFDAISVIEMKKDGAYAYADSWFEDYPKDEEHTTLNYNIRNDDDSTNDIIISPGRYKDATVTEEKVAASTVLYRNCNDYIAITMGSSVGNIRIVVNNANINSGHSFIYTVESCSTEHCNDDDPETKMKIVIQKNNEIEITNLSPGIYRVKIMPDWSWRYNSNVIFNVNENNIEKEQKEAEYVNINVYSDQYTIVKTDYNLINKKYLSDTIIK